MVTITGRTGADASYRLVAHLCRIFNAYEAKLRALISSLVASDVITAADAVVALNWIDATKAACSIMQIVSENSNVNQ